MASVARIGVAGVVVAAFAVAGAAQGQTPKPPPDPPSTVFGVNFLIKSQQDANFCIQVTNGTTEGRTISLQTCGGADTQRWVLTHNNDESNLIVDSQGMCLDARSRKGGDGLALPVQKCRFGEAWRFAVLGTGQIRDDKNAKCLQVPGPASNAVVSLADCDAAKPNQKWTLAH